MDDRQMKCEDDPPERASVVLSRVSIVLAVLLAATCLPAFAADGVAVRVVGDEAVAWLISYDAEAGWTRIAGRRKGKWTEVTAKSAGSVAAACAVEGDLHTFFEGGRQGAHWVWRLDGETRSPGSWPAGVVRTPLAACAAGAADGIRPIYLMLKSPKPSPPAPMPAWPTSRPTSMPASMPASGPTSGPTSGPASLPAGPTTAPAAGFGPMIFRGQGDQWTQVTTAPVGLLPPDCTYHMADTDEGLVVLACTADGWPVWMGRFADGRWHAPMPPPALRPGRQHVVSLAAAGEALWLAGTTDENDERTVWLGRLDPVTGELTGPGDVTREDETLTLSRDQAVAVTGFGEKLAITWGRGNAWTLAALDFDGVVNMLPDGDYNFGAPDDKTYRQLVEWLPLSLTVSLLIGLLWRRRQQQTAPFILPPQLVPAAWPKRMFAFLVDIVPFSFMVGSVTGLSNLGGDGIEQLLRRGLQGEWPRELLITSAWAWGMYLAYAVITEGLFGATVGKSLFRVRVVAAGGGRASFAEILLRNLSKVPELLPPMFLLFMVWPFFTQFRQRCGDIIANTAVVDRQARTIILSEQVRGQPPGEDAAGPPGHSQADDKEPREDDHK